MGQKYEQRTAYKVGQSAQSPAVAEMLLGKVLKVPRYAYPQHRRLSGRMAT